MTSIHSLNGSFCGVLLRLEVQFSTCCISICDLQVAYIDKVEVEAIKFGEVNIRCQKGEVKKKYLWEACVLLDFPSNDQDI